jgi:hypothetical protein
VLVVESGVLYVSWNGATKITSWLIFAWESERDLKIDGTLKSVEFGTMIEIMAAVERFSSFRRLEVRSCWVFEHCGGYFTGRKMAVLITSLWVQYEPNGVWEEKKEVKAS